ncbi:hypothetical protein F5Y08DRAFT_315959 [Xylaria arbuscula]|nr:hypothetical protein F5Y08DRAFT_315959 [Xylaria arbuscula]
MQVLDSQNQNHLEGHPDVYTLHPHQGFGDSAFYDINAIDQSLWSAHARTWHTDDFVASHDAIDNFVHLQQHHQQPPPPPPIDGTDNNDGCHVLDFHAPFVDWQSVVSFDSGFDKYKAPATPLDATVYPPTPQTLLTPLPATLQPLKEATLHDGMLSPVSPRSPEGVQTDQKKRNRNRLAAAKCRRKAKRGVDELQEKERDLLRENKMLTAQADALRVEVLQLKTEIFRHGKCDNKCISNYIEKHPHTFG